MHLKSNVFNNFTHHLYYYYYCWDIESIFLKGRQIIIKMCKQSANMTIKPILILALTFHLLFAKQLIAEAENDDESKQVSSVE